MTTTENNLIEKIGILFVIIFILSSFIYIITDVKNQRDEYYKAACILSDCCRNMKDAYGDKDSICIYYNNIAIEESIDNIFTNYYFCY